LNYQMYARKHCPRRADIRAVGAVGAGGAVELFCMEDGLHATVGVGEQTLAVAQAGFAMADA